MRRLLIAAFAALFTFTVNADVWQAEYGVARSFDFVLFNADGTLDVDEVDSGTEVTLDCNGTPATATNDFADEGAYYSIALTAAELQCERVTVTIAATDINVFHIQTFGDAAAFNETLGWLTGDAFARIGAAGAGLTNIDLPNQTMDITGNITGNLSGSVGSLTTNNDKTGYSLTQTFPTNFADLAITASTGLVTVGTNNDKTGYSLTQAFPTNFAAMDINATGGVGLDWGNVQNPTTTVGLSGTTIGTVVLSTSVNNCIPALGCSEEGTLNGTHSSTTADLGTNAPGATSDVVGKVLTIPAKFFSRVIASYDTGTGIASFSPATTLTLANADQWYLWETPPSPTPSQTAYEQLPLTCTVNTANFPGSTTTLACILTDIYGAAVTLASGKLTGLEISVTSGAQLREKRFINSTTWDAANSELQLTLSRALPATLANAVTVIIR